MPDSRADFAARINAGLKGICSKYVCNEVMFCCCIGVSFYNECFRAASDDTLQIYFEGGVTPPQQVDFGDSYAIYQSLPGDCNSTPLLNICSWHKQCERSLQTVFDDGISVTHSSGRFTIEDAQGRYLEVESGCW